MKNRIKLSTSLIFLASLVLFAVTGCSGGGSSEAGAAVPATQVVNTTGGSTEGTGVSSTEDIEVQNGNIVVNVENGHITLNGDNVQLAEQQADGSWILADGITITVADNSGANVSGTINVDPSTGLITFVPDASLTVSETYTITVTVNGVVYEATVILAVDNTESDESLFASVPIGTPGSYTMQDLNVNGKILFGWIFGAEKKRFSIKLTDLEAGAIVSLTAYGTYNIEGHQNDVFFQRWGGGSLDGTPVQDYLWTGFKITINEEDVSLDGETDYSFWGTYLELKVMKDGVDITATSGVKLVVESI